MAAKTFESFDAFVAHMNRLADENKNIVHDALVVTGELLKKKARDKIGHLQSADGPYDAWDQLAESTKRDKERKGYVFNEDYNPLFRTGELQDSIESGVIGDTVYTGSNEDIMIYQEEGTDTIPARPVLGPTMYESRKEIKLIIDKLLLKMVTGK